MQSLKTDGGAHPAPPDAPPLEQRIAGLAALPIGGLREAWAEAWGVPPPKGARRRLLMLGIAWKWQADVHGGLSRQLERRRTALEAGFRRRGTVDVAGGKPAYLRFCPAPGSSGSGRTSGTRSSSPRPAFSGRAATGCRSRPSPGRSPAAAATARPSSACARAMRHEPGSAEPEGDPLRDLHPQVHRGGSRTGLQLARCPARGLRRLHPQPEARRLDRALRPLRRRRLFRRRRWTALPSASCSPTSRPATSIR